MQMLARLIYLTNILLQSPIEAECLQYIMRSRASQAINIQAELSEKGTPHSLAVLTKENQITGAIKPCAGGNR